MNIPLIAGAVFVLAGVACTIFPVIPGLLLCYAAIILISAAYRWEPFSLSLLIILGIVACAVTALDFLVPKWREKKYGASKPGVLISVIGMLIGLLFLPPWGIFIGAFIGGLTGEILVRKRPKSAWGAGSGVLVGTILGIMLKVCLTGLMLLYFLKVINWPH
ncbi:MAG TPA: DUF456 domain-containing protein [Spirochaetota bacterium]|nr:DUF456 domain-containing protein [Spirochaetota bacterium]